MKKKIIIGYTTGVFDLFHFGHVNILKKSKSLCDKLIVGVSKDKLVLKYKKLPIIPEKERLKIVQSIKYVDYAIFQNSLDKFVNYRKLKFDIMFVDDWFSTPKWKDLDERFREIGLK